MDQPHQQQQQSITRSSNPETAEVTQYDENTRDMGFESPIIYSPQLGEKSFDAANESMSPPRDSSFRAGSSDGENGDVPSSDQDDNGEESEDQNEIEEQQIADYAEHEESEQEELEETEERVEYNGSKDDQNNNLLVNIKTQEFVNYNNVPEKLTFAGTLPVAYEQQHMVESDVIREVTEPTSPDPYYPIKRASLRTQSSDFGKTGGIQQATEQTFESPSKYDLIEPNLITGGVVTSSSHQILNLEQLEAIRETVERRISEHSSPTHSPLRSARKQSEAANLEMVRELQDANQSFPETAFSDLATEKHATKSDRKNKPVVTPDIRTQGLISKPINQEKDPKRPRASHDTTQTFSLSSTVDFRGPHKIIEEGQVSRVKPLREQLIAAKNRQKIGKITPKFILKPSPKPHAEPQVPKLSFYKLNQANKRGNQINSQSCRDAPVTATGRVNPKPLLESIVTARAAANNNLSKPLTPHSEIMRRCRSTAERNLFQYHQGDAAPMTPSKTFATRNSQLAFADSQLSSRSKQDRINQGQRAMKLSLLKASMREKPVINETSSVIASHKYSDPETGRQVNPDAKVSILAQDLIKNRPEVINQMQTILDVQEGLSFTPSINSASKSMHRSLNSLIEWKGRTSDKKNRLRQQSEEVEREKLKLSSKKLICPGSLEINRKNQRESLVKATGLSITSWLHIRAVDQRKKREQDIKRVVLGEKQRMTPELTKMARKAKPQYLDHYIKHKLSLESVPERVPAQKPQRTTPTSGAIDKYSQNEKNIQQKLLMHLSSSQSHAQFSSTQHIVKQDFATLQSVVPRKVQMLHKAGFNRNLLNDFLQKKYSTAQETQSEAAADNDQDQGTEYAESLVTGNLDEDGDGRSRSDVASQIDQEQEQENAAMGLDEASENLANIQTASNMQTEDQQLQATSFKEQIQTQLNGSEKGRNMDGIHSMNYHHVAMHDRESFGIAQGSEPVQPETFGKPSDLNSAAENTSADGQQTSTPVLENDQPSNFKNHSPMIQDQEGWSGSQHHQDDQQVPTTEDTIREQAHLMHRKFVAKLQDKSQMPNHQHPPYSVRKDCEACSNPQWRWTQVVKPNHHSNPYIIAKRQPSKQKQKQNRVSGGLLQEVAATPEPYDQRVVAKSPALFSEQVSQQISSIEKNTTARGGEDFNTLGHTRPITASEIKIQPLTLTSGRNSHQPMQTGHSSRRQVSDKQLNESADILNEMQSYTEQLTSPYKEKSPSLTTLSPPQQLPMTPEAIRMQFAQHQLEPIQTVVQPLSPTETLQTLMPDAYSQQIMNLAKDERQAAALQELVQQKFRAMMLARGLQGQQQQQASM